MEEKHSGLGIASFVLSLLVGILVFLLVAIAGIIDVSTPGGLDEESAGVMIVGLLVIALLLVDLVALGLGIGGLCQKNRKKIFAVLGTVFSSVILVGTILLMIIGNSMDSSGP